MSRQTGNAASLHSAFCVNGRVVRMPSYGARLVDVAKVQFRAMRSVVAFARKGA
jgi:ribosomal protein S4